MKNLIRLTDLQSSEVYEVFNIADKISTGKYNGFLNGKSVIFFHCFKHEDTSNL